MCACGPAANKANNANKADEANKANKAKSYMPYSPYLSYAPYCARAELRTAAVQGLPCCYAITVQDMSTPRPSSTQSSMFAAP